MTINMGLFWAIYMWGIIIGGIFNIFVLGLHGNLVYIILILSLAGTNLFI